MQTVACRPHLVAAHLGDVTVSATAEVEDAHKLLRGGVPQHLAVVPREVPNAVDGWSADGGFNRSPRTPSRITSGPCASTCWSSSASDQGRQSRTCRSMPSTRGRCRRWSGPLTSTGSAATAREVTVPRPWTPARGERRAAQQQPTHQAPCCAPMIGPPTRPSRHAPARNRRGLPQGPQPVDASRAPRCPGLVLGRKSTCVWR